MPGVCNGVFALTLNKENSKVFTLDGEIPRQTLTLETVKVSHTSTLEYVRVDLPFLSSSAIMNANNYSRLCIPLLSDGILFNPKWDLDMKAGIDSPFEVKVYKADGSLVTAGEFDNITLVFSFDYGSF